MMRARLATVVLVVTLVLAGCGDDSGSDTTASSASEAITEADALGVVEAYHEAAAAGDADAIAATFAEAPVIAGSANVMITVTAEGIKQTDQSYAPPLFPANEAFNAWMRANHPEDAAAADCCGEGGSLDDARADGELRRQYADLWAAHLAETGCTYTDVGC